MKVLRVGVAVALLFPLLAAGCGGGSSSPSGEALLFEYTLGDNGGTRLPGIAWYAAALGVETSPGSGSYPEVFEDDVLTPADVGDVIVVVEADDVEFPALVTLLTNGVDDQMRISLDRDNGTGAWHLQPESSYQFEVDQFGAPDLAGYFITRFELHVEEIRFEVPGTDPNGDGDWQVRFVEVRFEVFGVRAR